MRSKDAQANFSDLVGSVYYTKEPVIVERRGRPMAVVISSEQYDGYREFVMERFREARNELQRRNEDKDPEVVLRDVTAVVEEVRREQYEREHPGG